MNHKAAVSGHIGADLVSDDAHHRGQGLLLQPQGSIDSESKRLWSRQGSLPWPIPLASTQSLEGIGMSALNGRHKKSSCLSSWRTHGAWATA